MNQDTRTIFEEIKALASYKRENITYPMIRARIQTTVPCIPYLGMFLTDLTYYYEGRPINDKSTQSINFNSCMEASDLISHIVSFQGSLYDFPIHSDKVLRSFLTSPRVLHQSDAYKKSMRGYYARG